MWFRKHWPVNKADSHGAFARGEESTNSLHKEPLWDRLSRSDAVFRPVERQVENLSHSVAMGSEVSAAHSQESIK